MEIVKKLSLITMQTATRLFTTVREWYEEAKRKTEQQQQLIQANYRNQYYLGTARNIQNELFFVMQGAEYPYIKCIDVVKNIRFVHYSFKGNSVVFTYSVLATQKPANSLLNILRSSINQDIEYSQQDLVTVVGYLEAEINHPYIYNGMYILDMRYESGYICFDVVCNKI